MNNGYNYHKKIEIVKLLLIIKNGNEYQQQSTLRTLSNKIDSFGARLVFECILLLFMSSTIKDSEKNALIPIIDNIIHKYHVAIKPFTNQILGIISPLLIDKNLELQRKSKLIIERLTRIIGLSEMLNILIAHIEQNKEEEYYNHNSLIYKVIMEILSAVLCTYSVLTFYGVLPSLQCILPFFLLPQLPDKQQSVFISMTHKIIQQKHSKYIKPYLYKLFIVIQPLLIDDDICFRETSTTMIELLCYKMGIAEILSVLRQDIDNEDKYVRNLTAYSLAIAAVSFGMDAFLPFLKAICESNKSWLIRETGMNVIKRILLMDDIDAILIYPFLEQISELLASNNKYAENDHHENKCQGLDSVLFIKSLKRFIILGDDDCNVYDHEVMSSRIRYCDIDDTKKKLSKWNSLNVSIPDDELYKLGNLYHRCLPNMDSIIAFQHFIYTFCARYQYGLHIIDVLHDKIYQHELPPTLSGKEFYVLQFRNNHNIRFMLKNNSFLECSLFELIPKKMKQDYLNYNHPLIFGYITNIEKKKKFDSSLFSFIFNPINFVFFPKFFII